MNLVLLGFMGSGKSTLARELARLSGLKVIELDAEIVEQSQYESIPEIFSNDGESSFRALESQCLTEALGEQNFVLSPGGGIVESEANRRALGNFKNQTSDSHIIFLDTPFSVLEKRIENPEQRPLFADRHQAYKRFEGRLPYYRELSDIILPTEGHSSAELASIVASIMGIESSTRPDHPYKLWSVIGNPVGHSVSPRLHNAAFLAESKGERKFFSALKVSNLSEFMNGFRKNEAFQGLAVTIPYKEEIMPLLDDLSEEAKVLGAVNTVVKRGDKLFGENTDWIGIRDPLQKRTSLAGKRVAVLGAGGTARAALYALRTEGAQCTLVNRSVGRGEKVATEFGVLFIPVDELKAFDQFDIVVQTTSVGMDDPETSLFREDAFRSGLVVMDVIYVPRKTLFLQEAEKAGATTICGGELFLAQAEAQYTLHHGNDAPLGIMEQAVEDLL